MSYFLAFIMLFYKHKVILNFLTLFILTACSSYSVYEELLRNNIKVNGKIESLNCYFGHRRNLKNESKYSFEVGSKKYVSQMYNDIDEDRKLCANAKVGDAISIYYSPQYPNINSIHAPNLAIKKDLDNKNSRYFSGLISIGVWFFMPILIIISGIFFQKNKTNL